MALVLDATTKKLQAKTGEAITTSQPVAIVSWADMTTTAFTPGETDTTFNGTTAVDITAAPAGSTQRLIREIFIYNNDTVAHTFVVIYNNNATLRTISPNTSVPAGSVLYWSTESGWKIGVASGGGGGGSTTFIGLTDVPASYSGQGLKVVRVNAGATALEFTTLNSGTSLDTFGPDSFDPHTGSLFNTAFVGLAPFLAPADITIASIVIYAVSAAGTALVRPAIYSDSGGAPNTLLSGGTEITGAVQGFNKYALTTPQALTHGVMYWIGVGIRTANIQMAASTGYGVAYQGSYTGTLFSPFTPSFGGGTTWGTFWASQT